MIKFFVFCSCGALFLLINGCATVNQNPDILFNEPYNQVRYVAEPADNLRQVDVVQVTTRGLQANILNTVPALYEKVLENSSENPVDEYHPIIVSNITITAFTQRESFQVPHRHCYTTYIGSGATMTPIQSCTTTYTTQVRDVLYQKATTDVFISKE